MNIGDTAWVLVATSLVFLMIPGVGLFYAGMTRGKNALSILLQCMFTFALVAIQWAVIGYSLSFGPTLGGFIGSLSWLGLAGVGAEPTRAYAPSVPHLAFAMFQLMFAAITPALITGAFAERLKFPIFALFILLWSTLVYDPIAHWVWSCTIVAGTAIVDGCAGTPGILRQLGALDFAGGLVVHVSAGFAGLAAALAIGKRHGLGREPMFPHDISTTMLGAAILWFGWIGFNGGSALSANGLAANAIAVTMLSAAAAMIASIVCSWRFFGKPSVLAAASGAVAGMVAATPAAGYVTPMSGIAIGAVSGILCFLCVLLRERTGIDDSLDVFAVHGVGGIWGSIAVGIFATLSVDPAGANGLLAGNPMLLVNQTISVVVVGGYAFVASFVILKVLHVIFGARVAREDEEAGLDLAIHGEVVDYRVAPSAPLSAAPVVVASAQPPYSRIA